MSSRLSALQGHLSSPESRTPIRVVVTGAAGNIAYAILFHIGAGRMFGPNQPVDLRLLDIPAMADKIKGVEMEINDCAFPLIASMTCTTEYAVAFDACEYALLVGAKPRGPGMERKDLLTANAAIFAGQGKAINQYADRNVKVVVVGNPANTNALIASVNAPDIPAANFTALTRLDMNRAMSQISVKTGLTIASLRNVIIWGNHSKTQYPDISHATAVVQGRVLPLRSLVGDDAWVQNEFLTTVQNRGGAIIKARGMSSAASAANAVVDHVRDWFLGTAPGEVVSMGVPSDGSYGIPRGIVYSFPVRCFRGGRYEIVQGLSVDAFSRAKMDASTKELLEEKSQALGN